MDDLELTIDIAEGIKSKHNSIKALSVACSKACSIAESVILCATKLKAELKKKDAPVLVEPIQNLKESIYEVNNVMNICRDEALKAKLQSRRYLPKLVAAGSKIKDALRLLGEALPAISYVIMTELESLDQVLASMQHLDNDINDEVRKIVLENIEAFVPYPLKNKVATEDTKVQYDHLEEEDLMREKALLEPAVIEMVLSAISSIFTPETCLLCSKEISTIEIPEYFKCPLSLDLMEDPVYLTSCGRSFERIWLERALEDNVYKDPITGLCNEEKLSFGPNRSLKDAIEAWKQKNEYVPSHSPQPPPRAQVPSHSPQPPPRAQAATIRVQSDQTRREHIPDHLIPRWTWLLRLMHNDPRLTRIALDSKGIGSEGARAIAIALRTNTLLQILDLSRNGIGFKGAIAIATTLDRNHALRTLNLYSNRIGDRGAKGIATALCGNDTLRTLYLGWNGIGNEGAQAIAIALNTNTTLQQLDLSRSKIGDEGTVAMAKTLERNNSLHTLNFRKNRIGNAGAQAVAISLDTNASLQTLELGENGLGDKGAIAIANALTRNTALRTLSLDHNKIRGTGAIAIATALDSNTSLRFLNISRNFFQNYFTLSPAGSKLKKVAKTKRIKILS